MLQEAMITGSWSMQSNKESWLNTIASVLDNLGQIELVQLDLHWMKPEEGCM